MISQVNIIITTRNRKEELFFTLSILLKIGVNQNQILIADDASTDGTTNELRIKYPDIQLFCLDEPHGLMHNRNLLMHQCKNPFILSLDDDSHIRSREDLEEAIQILSSNDEWGGLSFKPFEQLSEPPLKKDLSDDLVEIKTYIGCGHLLKRELVEILGKYREEFVFYGEELDYSIRAWQAGYKIIMKKDLVVHHRIHWDLRALQLKNDLSKGVYGAVMRSKLGFSNHMIIAALYYPIGFDLLFIFKNIVSRFYHFALKKKDWKGFYLGLFRFIQFVPYCFKNSNKMSYYSFIKWIKLPDFSA